jgi:hypothetical protein
LRLVSCGIERNKIDAEHDGKVDNEKDKIYEVFLAG